MWPGLQAPGRSTIAGPGASAFLNSEIGARICKNKKKKATTHNLFDIEAFSLKGETNHVSWHGAFYQQFVTKLISAVHNAETLQRAGQQLVALADYALDL